MLTFASSISPVADPGTWAQIINSVHDWFGVIALSLLLAGFLVFSISKEWKNKPLVLTAVVGYLLLLVTAIIFISIPRPTPPQKPYVDPNRKLSSRTGTATRAHKDRKNS